MVQIRLGIFETNSSNMHCVVIPADVRNEDYVLKGIERWKTEKGDYEIIVDLDEGLLEEAPFSARRYVPHYALIDKLLYAYAVMIQHYQDMQRSAPGCHKPYNKAKDPGEELLNDKQRNRESEMQLTFDKLYKPRNYLAYMDFVREVTRFEKDFASSILWYCPSLKKAGVKVTVECKYYVDTETYEIHYHHPKEESRKYFSTGCWGNEEVYAALTVDYSYSDFILMPHSAILASTDEGDDEEYEIQKRDAARIIDEGYKMYLNHLKEEYDKAIHTQGSYPEDFIDRTYGLNPGKVIWPLGG